MCPHLIVDDNREFAENLAEIPRDRGAEVEASGGGEAKRRLGERLHASRPGGPA